MFTLSHIPLYIFVFIGLYFQIFLLLTFLEKEEKSVEKDEEREYPTVSVTVPCFNEETTVIGTLRSLLNVDYPKDKLSILVVDDGSTDTTYSVVKEFALQYPQIKLVQQKNSGKYTALNLGLKESTSELVTGLDADSFVDPQVLKQMIPYFDDPAIMAVTPAIRVHKPKTILQQVQRAEYNLGIFGKYIMGKIDAIHVTPGPLSIFRRKVFDTLGNYRHAHNTEDMEIAFRMQEHGYKITNCPTAFVYTVTPQTIRKLYVQRVRWISGFLKNSRDYKHLFFKKQYGNMGVFTLPFSLISIVAALYFFGTVFYNLGKYIIDKIVRFNTVGFTFNMHIFHFDWFFINTESIAILSVMILGLTLFLVLLGKKMAEGNMKLSLEIIYFMLLYGFLSPFWLTKSVYNTLASRKAPWR